MKSILEYQKENAELDDIEEIDNHKSSDEIIDYNFYYVSELQ